VGLGWGVDGQDAPLPKPAAALVCDDHAPWLRAEVGQPGVAARRAVTAQVDPAA
jgi:hypothetical protein